MRPTARVPYKVTKELANELWLAYLLFNRRYFRSRLPVDRAIVNVYYTPMRRGYMGCFRNPHPDVYKIEIAEAYISSRRTSMISLLHEMVHFDLDLKGLKPGHGHSFQREMKRLALCGALGRFW